MKGRAWINTLKARAATFRTPTLVLALFVLFTIVLTYPLAFSIFSALPGSGDIPQMVWYFWLTGQMLSHAGISPDIFHTSYIFYPDGIDMIPAGTMYNQLLALALTPLLGSIATLNILYLSAFALSGFGAYLMARHITRDDGASIVAGIVYTFAPYHFAHAFAGHMGSVTMQWIPFCALFLMKAFEERKIRYAVLASLFFILVAASDMQYMVYMGMFAILFIAYGVLSRRIKADKMTMTLVLIFGIIGFLGILPLTYSMISASLSQDNYLAPGADEAKYFSSDLLSFFVPAYFHPILGGLATSLFYANTAGGSSTARESTSYLGVSVLLLSVYAVLKDTSKKYLFWAISALLFLLLSLGPVLQVNGQDMGLPMPYSIAALLVPGLGNSRTPGRFDVLAVLSLSALAAAAVSVIGKKIEMTGGKKRQLKALFITAISAIVIFEYLAIPFATTSAEVPSFYYGLANETGDFAIMEIPATTDYYAGVYAEYYQTIHHKPMVGGQVARTPPDARDFEANTPFIHQLTYITNGPEDIFNQNVTDVGSSILQYYNIRYIIVHMDYITDPQFLAISDYLNVSPGLEPVKYIDGNISVYRLNNTAMKLFMVPQDGWLGVENWNGTPTRWIKNNGALLIYSPTDGEYNLSFTSSGIYGNRTLQVFVNGHEVYENKISPFFTTIRIPISLNEGSNTIRLISPEGSVRPHDIPGLNTNDMRDISFAFQDIRVV